MSDLKEYSILLRSVSVTMRATEMLYIAADLLTPGRNAAQRTGNLAIVTMVAALLGLPNTNPELVERVLRNLPEIDER